MRCQRYNSFGRMHNMRIIWSRTTSKLLKNYLVFVDNDIDKSWPLWKRLQALYFSRIIRSPQGSGSITLFSPQVPLFCVFFELCLSRQVLLHLLPSCHCPFSQLLRTSVNCEYIGLLFELLMLRRCLCSHCV